MRIGLIGYGEIAKTAMIAVAFEHAEVKLAAVLLRPGRERPANLPEDCVVVYSVDDLLATGVDDVFECAGHEAVATYVGPILRGGCPVSIVSTGALATPQVARELDEAAITGESRLSILSGALAGLEALSAARLGGLEDVSHTIVKPRMAWRNTAADALIPDSDFGATFEFFRGPARIAAQQFPKNANATAAVALAGVGFERTQTVMAAMADTGTNLHRVSAKGRFGSLEIEIAGAPLDGNAKTSLLAALSVARAIGNSVGRIVV